MKSTSVALMSLAGMLLTSVTVYSLTPPGGIVATADPVVVTGIENGGNSAFIGGATTTDLARFSAGKTLTMEGRLGHPRIVQSDSGDTFVMVEVKGTDTGDASVTAPVNLSLVIDRSGSMRGSRLDNAIKAAVGAVDRLNDGDVVSVVTFDTRTRVVVPPTTISSSSRRTVASDLRGITLGGDTCISCGIEDGMVELDRTLGRVNRMLLLSDGDANNGVRDVTGFRSIAQRARDRGASITTIGVDVDYNERILSAIAEESNGRHYFVENDTSLARVFEQEAVAATSAVASGAEVAIDLGPGVELERVFDRSFRRSGNRVLVPLGAFARGEVKTVLMKVRLPSDHDGQKPVADVALSYRDLLTDTQASCNGTLAAIITNDASQRSELDPIVAGRVERSETAATLKDANVLFAQGRVADARKRLEVQAQSLASAETKAKLAAPKARAADVDRDFSRQREALNNADTEFATPPAPASPFAAAEPVQATRAGKGAVKRNQEAATDLAF